MVSAAGTTRPKSRKAVSPPTRSVSHGKFMPKNPVVRVSGRKIVATSVSRSETTVSCSFSTSPSIA